MVPWPILGLLSCRARSSPVVQGSKVEVLGSGFRAHCLGFAGFRVPSLEVQWGLRVWDFRV